MKNLLALLALLPLLVAAQCNPTPQPPPAPPADAGTPPPEPTSPPVVVVDAGGPTPEPPDPAVTPGVRLACAKLAELHCVEGMAGCQRVLQKAVDARLTQVPLDCIVGAHSKPDVHACGPFVACP